MIGFLRKLLRLRGPAGVVALAVVAGTGIGLLVAHTVLAAWTYRDAARRDLRAPRRWALGVLVCGLFAFGPYVALKRASDWSEGSRGLQAARRAVDEGRRMTGRDGADAPPVPDDADDGTSGPGAVPVDGDPATGDEGDAVEMAGGPVQGPAGEADDGGRSLALTTARYGWRAARMGGRGARWAAGRGLRALRN